MSIHISPQALQAQLDDLRAQLATVTAENERLRKDLGAIRSGVPTQVMSAATDAIATARSEGWRAGVADSLAAVSREQLQDVTDNDGDRGYRNAIRDCERALRSLTETKGKEP